MNEKLCYLTNKIYNIIIRIIVKKIHIMQIYNNFMQQQPQSVSQSCNGHNHNRNLYLLLIISHVKEKLLSTPLQTNSLRSFFPCNLLTHVKLNRWEVHLNHSNCKKIQGNYTINKYILENNIWSIWKQMCIPG